MRYAARVALVSLMSLVFQLGALPSAEAAGPWQAQVVSAETKQPLEGVVVLAWWTRHVRSFGGPGEEYRDSQEVLTNKDGRFTIEVAMVLQLEPAGVFPRAVFRDVQVRVRGLQVAGLRGIGELAQGEA